MDTIELEHAELLAALNVMDARAVVSIPRARLFPGDDEQRAAMIRRGSTLLTQRGLMPHARNGHVTLDGLLAGLIATVAFPTIAIMLLHNDHDSGLQQYWFYQWDGHIVEHTMRGEQHTFHELEDLAALIERVCSLCGVQEFPPISTQIELAQDAFFTVKSLAGRCAHDEAHAILRSAGIADPVAEAFLHVLEEPFVVDNIVFLRCAKETVIDGRNLALLQDDRALWSARQRVPGVPKLIIETTGVEAMKKQLLSSYAELARV
jgi:hypothetical protein